MEPSEASSNQHKSSYQYDKQDKHDQQWAKEKAELANERQAVKQPVWIIQGTRQVAKQAQQPKLAPEELVGMQIASYALLNQLLAVIGKKERGALVAISEVLSAFKEGNASELEVIAVFFQQVRNGNVAGLENKKAILVELASSIKAEHTEELWKYMRSWAGTKGSKLELFKQFIQNNDSKEAIAFHAKNWFIQQQSEAIASMQALQAAKLTAEMEVIVAKAESKVASTREEKIAALANKATRSKLSDEEVTYLFTFADDEITNAAMEAQMELSSKAAAKEKLRSGNISSDDI